MQRLLSWSSFPRMVIRREKANICPEKQTEEEMAAEASVAEAARSFIAWN